MRLRLFSGPRSAANLVSTMNYTDSSIVVDVVDEGNCRGGQNLCRRQAAQTCRSFTRRGRTEGKKARRRKQHASSDSGCGAGRTRRRQICCQADDQRHGRKLSPIVRANVDLSATLMTDSWRGCITVGREFAGGHERVDHERANRCAVRHTSTQPSRSSRC